MVPKSRWTVAAAPGNGGSDNAVFLLLGRFGGWLRGVVGGGGTIVYVCSKVGCFLVSRLVVRSGLRC